MLTVHDVADYLIDRLTKDNQTLSLVKLHIILYYCHAENLRTNGEPLFKEKFYAWKQGPVCLEIQERFKDKEFVTNQDIRPQEQY